MTVRKGAGTLGVGIVGAGLMGGIHAECYARQKGCRVVGVYNPTRAKAEALARRVGGEAFDSWRALIDDERVQAVSIASPQAVHAEQVVAAADAGKHILCEKPLALTVAELDRIDKAVARAGVTAMVGHQLRFHPVVKAVRRYMRALGPLYHLDLEWALRIEGAGGRCWESYRLGGFFMELGCHLTDLARWLFGPISSVTGNTVRLNPKRVTEDHTQCLLQFATGAIAAIHVSANHRTTRQGLLTGRVLGEKGRIDFTIYPYARSFNRATLTLDHGKSIFKPDITVRTLEIDRPPSPVPVYAGFFDVYQQEIRAFVKAIRTGQPPPCTFEDGRSAVEVILATYDAQGQATRERNFVKRPKRYRSDASCHPPLRG